MTTEQSTSLMGGDGLLVIGASAGSGKTTRLTQEVLGAVDPGGASPVALTGLVAVTYTRKAAAELVSRIRRQLMRSRSGAHNDLALAYVGTVHAVCLRLVREFALDAGLSPTVDVLPDDEGRLLREVLEREMPLELHERMTELAERLEVRWDARIRRHDWVTPVEDIMTLARSNRIAPEQLGQMASRSVEGVLALLARPEEGGEALDATLERELRGAIAELERVNDGQKNTAGVLDILRAAARALPAARLPWSNWARMSRIAPGQACRSVVARLIDAAGAYERHPRLRADLREFTEGAYEAARIGLQRFAQWKARRRVVDYVDMVDTALGLLQQPTVREELSERLRLAVVDEFQDTSPVQLALFTALHQMAGKSVWVGDRKQCIFEYAGADPALMDSVVRWARGSGGELGQLTVNYRSRPELVEMGSALFTGAFLPQGFTADEVAVTANRVTPPQLASLPPMGVWWIAADRNEDEANAISAGVARLLARSQDTPIVDPETKLVRSVRPGDIAVLVATNEEAAAIAEALSRRGVYAALAREGLMSTPEGVFMTSALEYLYDSKSSLALASIEAVLGFGGQTPDRWIDGVLSTNSAAAADQAGNRGGGDAPAIPPQARAESDVIFARLDDLRPRIECLAPTEIVDLVLAEVDLPRICARWPDVHQRLGNLDALRGLAQEYERRCQHEQEAAGLAGLLRFWRSASTPAIRRDGLRASDSQHVRAGEDSVTVCTYHKAKGLEWPVVVMGSLNRAARRGPFEVYPESDIDEFRSDDPLAGRWIRYWVWPLGGIEKVPLGDAADRCAVGQRVAEGDRRERARLLYVGFTRARDHLILAARLAKKGPRIEWLDELKDANGRALITLPSDSGAGHIVEIQRTMQDSLKVRARVWHLAASTEDTVARDRQPARWFSRAPDPGVGAPGYWIAPSSAIEDWPECSEFEIGEIVRLGEGAGAGLPLPSEESERLGIAVHAFLAADVARLSRAERLSRASRLLAAAALSAHPPPEAIVEASDALLGIIEARWPASRVHREVPVSAAIGSPQGRRRVRGTIDMLVETTDGVVIIDHKTFPGVGEPVWRAKARDFGPQLVAYGRALRLVRGATVRGCWIHFVLSGALVEIRLRAEGLVK